MAAATNAIDALLATCGQRSGDEGVLRFVNTSTKEVGHFHIIKGFVHAVELTGFEPPYRKRLSALPSVGEFANVNGIISLAGGESSVRLPFLLAQRQVTDEQEIKMMAIDYLLEAAAVILSWEAVKTKWQPSKKEEGEALIAIDGGQIVDQIARNGDKVLAALNLFEVSQEKLYQVPIFVQHSGIARLPEATSEARALYNLLSEKPRSFPEILDTLGLTEYSGVRALHNLWSLELASIEQDEEESMTDEERLIAHRDAELQSAGEEATAGLASPTEQPETSLSEESALDGVMATARGEHPERPKRSFSSLPERPSRSASPAALPAAAPLTPETSPREESLITEPQEELIITPPAVAESPEQEYEETREREEEEQPLSEEEEEELLKDLQPLFAKPQKSQAGEEGVVSSEQPLLASDEELEATVPSLAVALGTDIEDIPPYLEEETAEEFPETIEEETTPELVAHIEEINESDPASSLEEMVKKVTEGEGSKAVEYTPDETGSAPTGQNALLAQLHALIMQADTRRQEINHELSTLETSGNEQDAIIAQADEESAIDPESLPENVTQKDQIAASEQKLASLEEEMNRLEKEVLRQREELDQRLSAARNHVDSINSDREEAIVKRENITQNIATLNAEKAELDALPSF